MIIIPAIDIRGGKVVRLLQGDFTKETSYSDNPVEIARRWAEEGAEYLHIVDLDGAKTGEPKNLDLVRKIKDEVGIPIEMGGGLRSEDVVKEAFSIGVSRAIIGTRAFKDPEFLKGLLKQYKGDIAVGIDAKEKQVVAEGWISTTDLDAVDLARQMQDIGVETIIYTNVLRDGTLERPQFELVKEMLDSVDINVIISGGISSIDDIKGLMDLNKDNLYGVIVGKALYEGRVSLAEVISITGA